MCLTLCDPMDCSTPGLPVHYHLLDLGQTHVHWVGDAIQPPHLLSSPSPAFNLSQHQGLFKWVSSSHQVAKVLELSFSISPSNQYSGLISFSIDWFDLLAAQGTLKSQGWAQNLKAVLVWTQCGPVSIKPEAWWWGSLQFIAHTLIKLLCQNIKQECSCQ